MFDLGKKTLGNMRAKTSGFAASNKNPAISLAGGCTGSCRGTCKLQCKGCKGTCKGKCKGSKKGK